MNPRVSEEIIPVEFINNKDFKVSLFLEEIRGRVSEFVGVEDARLFYSSTLLGVFKATVGEGLDVDYINLFVMKETGTLVPGSGHPTSFKQCGS